MIGAPTDQILIHVPIEPALIRTNSGDIKCFRLSQGFCFAEYQDGNIFQISNPLEQWLMGVNTNADNVVSDSQIFFIFEAPGKRGNPGQDDEGRSIHDIQTALA